MTLVKKEILHKAIDLLSRREHSVKELCEKLQSKAYLLDDISPVIHYLQEKNYQSDTRYAESYYRTRVNKGYGWRYISSALIQKGVSHAIIAQLKDNEEFDWYHQAELAYNKRFGERPIVDNKDKAKRIRFMQSRGFSTDQILAVLNH